MSLKLGVPSKGRLMEKTFAWFAKARASASVADWVRQRICRPRRRH